MCIRDSAVTHKATACDYTQPQVTIASSGTGNVTIAGLISAVNSTVTISWMTRNAAEEGRVLSAPEIALGSGVTCGDGNPVTIAPIFAKNLTVQNARNIGSENTRFAAYIFGGEIRMDAADSIWARLTPTALTTVDSLEDCEDAHLGATQTLKITDVRGDVLTDLSLAEAITIYQLKGSGLAVLPVPGSADFLNETVSLTTNCTLSESAMAPYLRSTDTDGRRTYDLPNGTKIVTDSEGALLYVTETADGKEMLVNLADYGFNGKTLTVSGNLTLDVTTGILTVAMNANAQSNTEILTTEVSMSGISGSWLKSMLDDDRFRFVLEKRIIVPQKGDVKEHEDIEEITVQGITSYKTVGTKQYYWLNGYSVTAGGTAWTNTVAIGSLYYLVLDTSTDEVTFYSADIISDTEAATQTEYMPDSTASSDDIENYLEKGRLPRDYYYDSDSDFVLDGESGSGIAKSLKPFRIEGAFGIAKLWLEYDKTANTWKIGTTKVSGEDQTTEDISEAITLTGTNGIYQITSTITDESINGLLSATDLSTIYFDYSVSAQGSGKEVDYVIFYSDSTIVSWETLQEYKLTFRYVDLSDAKCTPVSMDVTQDVTPTEKTTNAKGQAVYNIRLSELDKNETATAAFSSETEDLQVKMRKLTIGTGTKSGYRLTESLYAYEKSGKAVAYITNGASYSADFDGKKFDSTYLTVSDVTKPELTLKSGTRVHLEMVTNDVARTVSGVYYCKVNGSWTNQSVTAQEETIVDTEVCKAFGKSSIKVLTVKYDKTAMVSVYSDNGVTRNWIRSGDGTGLVIGSDGEVTSIGAPNILQHVRVNSAILKNGSYEGNIYEIGSVTGKRVNLRLEGPHSTLAQVGSGITADEAKIFAEDSTLGTAETPLTITPYTAGGTANLTFVDLEGKQVLDSEAFVEINGNGSIVSTRIDGGKLDYTASGNITFDAIDLTNGAVLKMEALGSVQGNSLKAYITKGGTGNTDAKIKAGETLRITTVDLDDCSTTLTSADDMELGTVTMRDSDETDKETLSLTSEHGGITVTGASDIAETVIMQAETDIRLNTLKLTGGTLTANSSNGGIAVPGTADLTEGAVASLTAEKDIAFAGTLAVNGSSLTATSKDGTLTAAGAIGLTGSEATFSAKRGIELQNTLTMNGSSLTATSSDGALHIVGKVLAEASTLTADVGGALMLDSTLDGTGSDFNLTVGGDTVLGGVTTLTNGKFSLTGSGSLKTANVSLDGGSFTADVKNDIEFPIIESRGTATTLTSREGSIRTTAPDGYIRFRTAEKAKLTLSALGDIGEADHRVIIDTDDTLYITHVDNYFIDSVELLGDALYTGARPTVETGSGMTQSGEEVSGEKAGTADPETIYEPLLRQSAEEIADMLVQRIARSEVMQLLNADVLTQLIAEGSIAEDTLNELLPKETVKDLLKQGEKGDGEVYKQLADLLLPLTEETQLDEQGLPQVDDAKITSWLAAGIDYVDQHALRDTISENLTEEEIAEVAAEAQKHLDYASRESTRPDETRRAISIDVGEATGAAFVTNEGDITITQHSGTLTAGEIKSDKYNVTLISENGAIEGADDFVNITAENVTLTAAGGVGDTQKLTLEQRERELVLTAKLREPVDRTVYALDADGSVTDDLTQKDKWALQFTYDFAWLWIERSDEAKRLDVTAGGDVNITEMSGDMGLGEIRSCGNVALAAPDSILDTRTDTQTQPNLTASGNVDLTAKNGTIGETDRRITTDADGMITAEARGDISVDDIGTLDLVAQSGEGQVNVSAKDDLNLANRDGDLTVGPIEAGGTARITAQQSITAGDRLGRDAQVKAESIELYAKSGIIGTETEAFRIDTDSAKGGTLTASGENLNITELTDDLILKSITASENAALSAPESILDGNTAAGDDAAEAQEEANSARAEAKAAEAEAYVKREKAKTAEEAVDEAQQALDELLQDPDAEQTEIEAAQQALEETQKALTEAETEAAEAEAEARRKQDAYEAAQQAADRAKQDALDAGTTAATGGDLTLHAGDDIGEAGHGLSVQTGGTVNAETPNDLYLDGIGDLTLTGTEVKGHIGLNTLDGDIRTDGTLKSDTLDANSLGGSLDLDTDAKHIDASGENITIRSEGDTTIGQISAEENLKLDVSGKVGGDAGTKPNILAKDAELNADAGAGSEEDPLDTVIDNLHGQSSGIYIENHSKDLDISNVNTQTLDVRTDGNATGRDIHTGNITVHAGGNVGTAEEPLTFYAYGSVDIRAGLNSNYRNLYAPLRCLLVLRFDLAESTLYVILSADANGKLTILGVFLAKGETDEAFWTDVFEKILSHRDRAEIRQIVFRNAGGLAKAARAFFGDSVDILNLTGADEASAAERITQALGEYVPDARALLETVGQFRSDFAAALATFEDPAAECAPFLAEYIRKDSAWKSSTQSQLTPQTSETLSPEI